MYKFFRTFLRMYIICFIRNVQKLCTDIYVQCTRNEQKTLFFLYNVQEFGWIPVHLLVHFTILEILVHFYPISIGLKQATFWYFSRTRPSSGDYTCNSCDENYWGHCGSRHEALWGWWCRGMFFLRIPMDNVGDNVAEDTDGPAQYGCAHEVLTISTRVWPWCTFNYYYQGTFVSVSNTLWQSIEVPLSWHWAVMLSRSIIIRRADSQSVEFILGCLSSRKTAVEPSNGV